MEKKTYTDQDKMDNFSIVVDHFNRHKVHYDNGLKVSRPRKRFGCYYNHYSGYFGVYIDVVCNNYDSNLKRIKHYITNYSVDLIINEEGKYVPKDVPKNISEFVTEEGIKGAIKYVKGTFGPDFESKFEVLRNTKASKNTIKKYKL